MRRVAAAALMCCLATSVAACSSSGAAAKPPSSTPPPTSSSASSSSAPPTTSVPPTPPTSSAPPLSPFETDPAVHAMRVWAVQYARTINTGHYDSPALDRLMTATVKNNMKATAGSDLGLYYPGPLPFTPIRVTVVSPTVRAVRICAVGSGFAQKRSTHKPAAKRTVVPVDIAATESGGRWIVSKMYAGTFSCSGVTVREVTW